MCAEHCTGIGTRTHHHTASRKFGYDMSIASTVEHTPASPCLRVQHPAVLKAKPQSKHYEKWSMVAEAV